MSRHLASLIMICSAMGLASCEDQASPPEAPRPVLSVIATDTQSEGLMLAGTVVARIETQLSFRTLGRLATRDVNVGDVVKAGDVLASIDKLTFELAVRSAESELSNAEAQLQNAVATEEREGALAKLQATSKAALENAQYARRSAAAAVAKASANLKKAKEQLLYTELRSEFDGVVTQASAEVGQVVSPSQVIVTVARPEDRDVVVDVPLADSQQLVQGAPFEINLQLDPSIRVRGAVREIGPEADAATRTRRVKITMSSPSPLFRLGAVVHVRLTAYMASGITLPAPAILTKGASTSVFVVDEKGAKVVLRSVEAAENPAMPGYVVVKGVAAGDRIVVAGVNKLKDGQAIRVDQEASK